MMVDPVGPNDDKAQRIDQKFGCQRRQKIGPKLTAGGSLRQLQFEHHDGNDDGNDAVAESGDALHARTVAAVLDLHHFPPCEGSGRARGLAPRALAKRPVATCVSRCQVLPVPETGPAIGGVLDLALGEKARRPLRSKEASVPAPGTGLKGAAAWPNRWRQPRSSPWPARQRQIRGARVQIPRGLPKFAARTAPPLQGKAVARSDGRSDIWRSQEASCGRPAVRSPGPRLAATSSATARIRWGIPTAPLSSGSATRFSKPSARR